MNISNTKKAQKTGLLLLTIVLTSVLLLSAALVLWGGNITGYQSLNTFETDTVVTGSSIDNSLRFEQIPNFVTRVGEETSFRVVSNKDNVIFREDTNMFDITSDGKVEFKPERDDVGTHNVWIIIKNKEGNYYYQNVVIIVEE